MKRIFLKALKTGAIAIASFAGFVILYFISAYTLSRIPVNADSTGAHEMDVYLFSNGVHTDLVMPVKTELFDWSKEIPFDDVPSRDSSMHYIGIGWGDKGFYLDTPTWADLKFSTAFNAVFFLSTTAMHTTYYKSMTEGNHCFKASISKAQYEKLLSIVRSSFQRDASGKVIHIKNHSYGRNDAFYEAYGTYSLFYTCNSWTNNALKHAGLRACVWTPFDSGLLKQYSGK